MLEEQIQALQEILGRIDEMLQQKTHRSRVCGTDRLQRLKKITEEQLCRLEDENLLALVTMASAEDRATGGSGLDIDAFRNKAQVLCRRLVPRAIDLRQTAIGRIPTLGHDMEVVKATYEALLLGWERRNAQGLPMPSWDASQPSVSKTSGFWLAITACLDTIGFHRPLTKARMKFVRDYWLRVGEIKRRRGPRRMR